MREICAILKLAVVALLSTVIGCATLNDHSTTRSKKGIDGMWQGNLINSEELTNKIELFVFENGEHLQGSYSCARGSTTCLNGNTAGTLKSASDSSNFEVMLQDSTLCRFFGNISEAHASGKYSCYLGGAVLDHGSWQLDRLDVPQR
jgi:hypothetical protein